MLAYAARRLCYWLLTSVAIHDIPHINTDPFSTREKYDDHVACVIGAHAEGSKAVVSVLLACGIIAELLCQPLTSHKQMT